jgi:hypothetical protein
MKGGGTHPLSWSKGKQQGDLLFFFFLLFLMLPDGAVLNGAKKLLACS